jgi:hypothetical protein
MSSRHRSVVRQPLRRIEPETLALFLKLENMRPSKRDRAEERRLHETLDLLGEWFCSCEDVFNRRRKPLHPPGYPQNDAFYRCRLVRLALLEAAKAAASVT